MKKRLDLPFNIDAEKVVIGSAILSSDALYKMLSMLKEEDFYEAKHIIIFQALYALENKGIVVDHFTLTEELLLMNQLDNVGGVDYLKACTDCVVALGYVEYYINIVKDNSNLRKFLTTIREIDADYTGSSIDSIESFIKTSEEKIRTCIDENRTSTFKKLGTFTDEAVMIMKNQKISGDGYTTGITSGFENINKFTYGFHKGEVTVVGARSSVGKTALALNMAYRAALRGKVPVAIFELEMTGITLAKRMMSMISNVDGFKIETGVMSDEERVKVYLAAKELNELPIFIDENGNTTMMDVENKTRELLKKYPDLGLVVVDHISIVKTTGGKKSDTRVDEMRKISHQLHSLAKELDIAILAVAQLNRDSVKGVVRRPRLSDIKESGAIEEDADVIILLYDELYENDKPVQDKRLENSRHIEAIVAKQRNGRTGVAHLIFHKAYSRYDCFSPEQEAQLERIAGDIVI